MKILPTLIFLGCSLSNLWAQDESQLYDEALYKHYTDSIENTLHYEYGEIDLQDGLATLTVPPGYKYLDPDQSEYVLTDLWGNPPDQTLGMLFPEDVGPLSDDFTYVVEIKYSEEGYIEDEDAEEIDYDDLLLEMQEDTEEANLQRQEQGYEAIELVGWASKPFYDGENKKLHWAKELRFGDADLNTLNYNIRVLGRKGILNLNAIGNIDVLPKVNEDVPLILSSVEFNEGSRYEDFNPSMDRVAAYGIGGLVAGKVLAKAGFFALLLKFWKVIAIGIIGLFAAFKKRIFGTQET